MGIQRQLVERYVQNKGKSSFTCISSRLFFTLSEIRPRCKLSLVFGERNAKQKGWNSESPTTTKTTATSTSTTTLLVDRSQFRWPVFVTGSLPRVTYLERTEPARCIEMNARFVVSRIHLSWLRAMRKIVRRDISQALDFPGKKRRGRAKGKPDSC